MTRKLEPIYQLPTRTVHAIYDLCSTLEEDVETIRDCIKQNPDNYFTPKMEKAWEEWAQAIEKLVTELENVPHEPKD